MQSVLSQNKPRLTTSPQHPPERAGSPAGSSAHLRVTEGQSQSPPRRLPACPQLATQLGQACPMLLLSAFQTNPKLAEAMEGNA